MAFAFIIMRTRATTNKKLLKLYRRDDHAHDPAVKHGRFVNATDLTAAVLKLLHDLLTDTDVTHLTSLKAHNDSDLIARLKEFLSVTSLGLEIVSVDPAGELYLLELDGLLFFLGFLFLFVSFKAELTVVHYTAYRRLSLGSHQNKIITLIVSELQSGVRGHDPYCLAVNTDNSYLFEFDLLVDHHFFCANTETPPNLPRKGRKKIVRSHSPHDTTRAYLLRSVGC